MNIVVLDGYAMNPGDMSWDELGAFGELTVYDRTPVELILERALDADAVFTNKTPLNRETIEKLPGLKYIGVLATGYNVVDVKAATEKGITVTNIPGYSTDDVAQFVMALVLELCHHVGEHAREVRNGSWCSSIDFSYWSYPLIGLKGKTMGIIGFGQIGRAVAKLASAFGMRIFYNSRSRKEYDVESGAAYTNLDELLKNSDIVSLNCPLTDDTEGLINRRTLSLMKKTAFIINTSRGPVVNEQDLADSLNLNQIAGAGLDVLSVEPALEANPLLSAKNCIITPHIAWATNEARQRLMKKVIGNFKAFLDGNPENVVN